MEFIRVFLSRSWVAFSWTISGSLDTTSWKLVYLCDQSSVREKEVTLNRYLNRSYLFLVKIVYKYVRCIAMALDISAYSSCPGEIAVDRKA